MVMQPHIGKARAAAMSFSPYCRPADQLATAPPADRPRLLRVWLTAERAAGTDQLHGLIIR